MKSESPPFVVRCALKTHLRMALGDSCPNSDVAAIEAGDSNLLFGALETEVEVNDANPVCGALEAKLESQIVVVVPVALARQIGSEVGLRSTQY